MNLDYPTSGCNPQAISSQLARVALAPFTAADLHAAGELARGALQGELAGGEAFRAVQAISGCAAYAFHEDGRLTGALAIIPLRMAALPSLRDDSFDSLDPDLGLVARPGEPLAAVYAWGIVGGTRRARAAVLAGLARLQRELGVPFFCRAATDDGQRVILGRLGYRPQPGSASGLFVFEPTPDMRRAA